MSLRCSIIYKVGSLYLEFLLSLHHDHDLNDGPQVGAYLILYYYINLHTNTDIVISCYGAS